VLIEFEYLDHLHDSRFPPGTLGAQISFITQVLENLVDCVETSVINGGLHFGDISEGVDPEGDMGTQQWLDFFRPFTAAEHLIVGENIVPAVARVLRGPPEGMATEVLPALCRLTFGKPDWTGSLREAIEPFPTARELSGPCVSRVMGAPVSDGGSLASETCQLPPWSRPLLVLHCAASFAFALKCICLDSPT
jgi:hypothetical protein